MEKKASLTEAAVNSLGCLIEASRFALDVGAEMHQFAVEQHHLQSLGLGCNELRWLIARNLIVHLSEMTLDGDSKRYFRELQCGRITERSCFVVTETGAKAWEDATNQAESDRDPALKCPSNSSVAIKDVAKQVPVWDPERQELLFSGQVVKRFRLPSENQIAILATFEEERWPRRIYDPLRGGHNIDPKRRLQDTIKGLNRSQKVALLKFEGDGSGEGIVWEIRNENQGGNTAMARCFQADATRRSG